MNEMDWILLVIIAAGVFVGLWRGFIRILLSILGIYLTIIVVGYAYRPISMALSGGLHLNRTGTDNFTYLVLVIAMTAAVEIISRSAFEVTHVAALSKLDNLLGGLIGIAYGMLWASLFLVPIQYDIFRNPLFSAWRDAVAASQLVPHLNGFFDRAVLNVLDVFFKGGLPVLFRNSVAMRTAWLGWLALF